MKAGDNKQQQEAAFSKAFKTADCTPTLNVDAFGLKNCLTPSFMVLFYNFLMSKHTVGVSVQRLLLFHFPQISSSNTRQLSFLLYEETHAPYCYSSMLSPTSISRCQGVQRLMGTVCDP